MQIKDKSGRIYEKNDTTGVITRIHPQRPWRGKSERRLVIKARNGRAVTSKLI